MQHDLNRNFHHLDIEKSSLDDETNCQKLTGSHYIDHTAAFKITADDLTDRNVNTQQTGFICSTSLSISDAKKLPSSSITTTTDNVYSNNDVIKSSITTTTSLEALSKNDASLSSLLLKKNSSSLTCHSHHQENNQQQQFSTTTKKTDSNNHLVANDEVELISLLNSSYSHSVPKYKLRIDTITEFQGYRNNDWAVIETPLIDLEQPLDENFLLRPAFLRETFKLFLQSGERLTQMTKVYNDVEVLTKLLEEKERDVELAARIGQSLLDQNQNQSERIDELEKELSLAKDKITQLKHDVSSKSELLRFYITKDEDEIDDENDSENDMNYASISSQHSISQKDTSQILDQLERRVNSLEEENSRLKVEKEAKVSDLEDEEQKELQLINECARRLSQTNKQIASLQEDITKKNDENNHLTKELQLLKKQVQQLEKQIRTLTLEKEELVGALNLAHECQTDLTIELIDVKEKHKNLLTAFHEKREECRQLREQQLLSDPIIFSYVDSLAYELENSFQFDENTSKNELNHSHHQHSCSGNCFTPDSLLSNDSFYSSSPCSSMIAMTSSITAVTTNTTQQQSSLNASNCLISSTSKQSSSISTLPSSSTSSSQSEPSKRTKSANHQLHHHHYHRNLFLTDKLRYIKPLEGSQILNQWRRLANPNLNDLFGDQDRYVSRIKANLQATAEINRKCVTASLETSSSNSSPTQTIRDNTTAMTDASDRIKSNDNVDIIITSLYSNNFVTTNSVFTFTTTSISHTKDSMTEVTTTFSDVQPSTGKNEFSFDKHFLTSTDKHHPLFYQQSSSLQINENISSICHKNKNPQNSLNQLHKKISLVEQVKSIMKVDQLSSADPGSKLFSTSISSEKFKENLTMTETNTNNEYSSMTIDQSKANVVDTKVDRISGLNEFVKLFASEPKSCVNNNKNQSVAIGGGRIITKLQMANDSITSFRGQKFSSSKTTSASRMSQGEQQTSNRTNLSVLRNLRKGGLI